MNRKKPDIELTEDMIQELIDLRNIVKVYDSDYVHKKFLSQQNEKYYKTIQSKFNNFQNKVEKYRQELYDTMMTARRENAHNTANKIKKIINKLEILKTTLSLDGLS